MTEQHSKSPEQFAALRDFLRGYLHEDWKLEYGSAEHAVQQFWNDADPEQRDRLSCEWQEFVKSAKNQPLEKIAHRLAQLGSAWRPSSARDLEAISLVLQRHPCD